MRKSFLLLLIIFILCSSFVFAQHEDNISEDEELEELQKIVDLLSDVEGPEQWSEEECKDQYYEFKDAFNFAVNNGDFSDVYALGQRSVIFGTEHNSPIHCDNQKYGGLAAILHCELANIVGNNKLSEICYIDVYDGYVDVNDLIARNALFRYLSIAADNGNCIDFVDNVYLYENWYSDETTQLNVLKWKKAKCEAWIDFHNNNYELIYGDGDRDKFDIMIYGHNFNDTNKFKSIAKDSIENGFFFVPEWEGLAEEEIQKKFNVYSYNKILEKDICGPSNGGACNCYGQLLEMVNRASGMDRHFVLSENEDSFCISAAIRGESAVVTYVPTNEDESGNVYDSIPILDLLRRDYLDPEGNFIVSLDKINNNEYAENDMMNFYNINELVILHESGHAFYGFADEYINKDGFDAPREPNCLDNMSQAEEWWSEIIGFRTDGFDSMHPTYQSANEVGYFDGCSLTTGNYRSTFNSIMNDHGKFSTANLKGSFGFTNDVYIRIFMEEYPS